MHGTRATYGPQGRLELAPRTALAFTLAQQQGIFGRHFFGCAGQWETVDTYMGCTNFVGMCVGTGGRAVRIHSTT